MKRTVLIALIVAAFCFAGDAPAQNSDRASIGMGFEYRSKKMDMKAFRFEPPIPELDANLELLEVQQEYNLPMFSINLGLMQYVDLKFLFGSIDYDLTQDSELEGFSHGFESDSENVFGFGGKLILPFTETFLIGIHFEHFTVVLEEIKFSTASPTMSFTLEDGRTIPIDVVTPEKLRYNETTLTPTVAVKFGKLMPYAGPRYTRSTAKTNVTYTIFGEELEREIKYEVEEKLSFVLGVVAWLGDNLSISAEFETLEQESYSVGVRYTF